VLEPVEACRQYALANPFDFICLQLADFQDFPTAEQHALARTFTLIMSGGVVASFIVGWLMDRIGLVICSTLTLLLGMLHMVVLTHYSDERQWMLFGFFVYVMFRQFLFPVYIASLTARLGYKYFGLLNGLGFALAGVAQAFMASLVTLVQGTCHMSGSEESSFSKDDCEHGHWQQLHGIEFILLGLLILVPFFDHREKTRQEKRIEDRRRMRESWKNLKLSPRSSTNVLNYGSLATHDESGLSDETEHSIGMEL
jgi:MFS family permease